jgi:hypothetical protein
MFMPIELARQARQARWHKAAQGGKENEREGCDPQSASLLSCK